MIIMNKILFFLYLEDIMRAKMIGYTKKSLLSDYTITHKCMLLESYSFFLITNPQ